MSNAALAMTPRQSEKFPEAIEKALMDGDLKSLSTEERVKYYYSVCDSLGLNPLTRPFKYIVLNGKLTLYAAKDCTEQLRNNHKVSTAIKETKMIGDVFLVIASCTTKDGRFDESTGAVYIKGLVGDALANAYMKAETKAKRRGTLSICGLSFPDESELESIKGVVHVSEDYDAPPSEPKTIAPKSPEILYDTNNVTMREALQKFFDSKGIDPTWFNELSEALNGRPYKITEFEAFLKENNL